MNDLQNILQGSIKQFQDHENNALACASTYLVGSNGLSYILPGAVELGISCALHVDTSQLQRPDGIYNSAFVQLDTQSDLFALFENQVHVPVDTAYYTFSGVAGTVIPRGTTIGNPSYSTIEAATIPASGSIDILCEPTANQSDPSIILVYYRGYTIGINKTGSYNHVAKTWHYVGEIIQNKNSHYIVATDEIVETMFLSNSTVKWILFGNYCGVPCYPSFLTPSNLEAVHLVVEVTRTDAINIVSQITDTTKKQLLMDSCRVYLINGTLNQAQDIAEKMYEQARALGLFGCFDFPSWVQVNDDTQTGFGIKANKRVMDMRINYVLESGATSALKYITQAAASLAVNSIGGE